MTDNEAITAIHKELASLAGKELSPEKALAVYAQLGEYEKYLEALQKLEGVKLEIAKRDLKRAFDFVSDERDAARESTGRALGMAHRQHRLYQQATSSQGGTDRALTQEHRRIAELEATVAELTKERDAARRAYLALLDQSIKGSAK